MQLSGVESCRLLGVASDVGAASLPDVELSQPKQAVRFLARGAHRGETGAGFEGQLDAAFGVAVDFAEGELGQRQPLDEVVVSLPSQGQGLLQVVAGFMDGAAPAKDAGGLDLHLGTLLWRKLQRQHPLGQLFGQFDGAAIGQHRCRGEKVGERKRGPWGCDREPAGRHQVVQIVGQRGPIGSACSAQNPRVPATGEVGRVSLGGALPLAHAR